MTYSSLFGKTSSGPRWPSQVDPDVVSATLPFAGMSSVEFSSSQLQFFGGLFFFFLWPSATAQFDWNRSSKSRKESIQRMEPTALIYVFWNLVRTAACRKDRSALKNNTTMWRERTKLVIVVIGSSPQEECRREENEKSTREKIEFFSTSLKLVIDILVYVITYEVPIFYYYFHNGKRFGFPSS